jgi:hypothetical protein
MRVPLGLFAILAVIGAGWILIYFLIKQIIDIDPWLFAALGFGGVIAL